MVYAPGKGLTRLWPASPQKDTCTTAGSGSAVHAPNPNTDPKPSSRLGIRTELRGVCFYIFGNTPVEPGKLCFSLFGLEFIQVPRAVLGQNGPKAQYFAISRPWGSGRPKRKAYKSCAISGRIFFGRPDFFLKSTSSTGKLRFSVFRPEFP